MKVRSKVRRFQYDDVPVGLSRDIGWKMYTCHGNIDVPGDGKPFNCFYIFCLSFIVFWHVSYSLGDEALRELSVCLSFLVVWSRSALVSVIIYPSNRAFFFFCQFIMLLGVRYFLKSCSLVSLPYTLFLYIMTDGLRQARSGSTIDMRFAINMLLMPQLEFILHTWL